MRFVLSMGAGLAFTACEAVLWGWHKGIQLTPSTVAQAFFVTVLFAFVVEFIVWRIEASGES